MGVRAVVRGRYGGPEALRVEEVADPTPGADQILVRVVAASVNRSDWEALIGRPVYARTAGLFRPRSRLVGSDVAGVVVGVGREVVGFSEGDEVFGDLMYHGSGTFAEFATVRATAPLAIKSPSVTFEAASCLPQAGVLALQALDQRGGISQGDRVLVIGGGGGGGTLAIELAASNGARVTGVDTAEKADFMRSLGAVETIDYETEDFAAEGIQYNRIVDFVGRRSVGVLRRSLTDDGVSYTAGGPVPRLLEIGALGGITTLRSGRTIRILGAKPSAHAMRTLDGLTVDGDLRPVVDAVYGLDRAAEALERVGAGATKGKVVVTP